MYSNIAFNYRDRYSRLQLISRTLLSWLYIVPVHGIILFFVFMFQEFYKVAVGILALFTGEISNSYTDFQINVIKWKTRLNASLQNIIDGYPAIGLNADHPDIIIEKNPSTTIERSNILIRLLFSAVLLLPFSIWFAIMGIVMAFTVPISALVVLFTGHYPSSIYKLHVKYLTVLFNHDMYHYLLNIKHSEIWSDPVINNLPKNEPSNNTEIEIIE